VAAGVVTGIVVWLWRPPSAPPAVQRLVVTLPSGDEFAATGRTFVALSPDGSRLAYVANQQLYLRPLDQLAATLVPGTGGATSPFFSPDGQHVGFWQNGELKKMAVAGGVPQVICTAANPFGVNWAQDGTILFGQGPDGIFRVSAEGGAPAVVAHGDGSGDVYYGPELLPDGRTLLFTIDPLSRRADSAPGDHANVVIQDLESGSRRVIVQGGTQGRFVPTGHVVFARQQALWALRFDPRSGNPSGSPRARTGIRVSRPTVSVSRSTFATRGRTSGCWIWIRPP
jgi:serine/threonine-protein kinase